MPLAAFPKCFLDAMSVHHTLTVDAWIDLAADQLDIDGLEFYWGFTPYSDPLEMLRLRARVESKGLTIPMMCFSPDFTQPDPAAREREVEKTRAAISATAQLGGKMCRVLSGQKRPEVPRNEGLQMAADAIISLLPHAEQQGITLILENHYKDGYWDLPEFAQRQEEFLALLALIPESPHFGVNYDPSNAVIAGDDPISLLEAVKSRVVSMHASDRYFEGGTLEDLRQQDLHPQKGYAGILKHGVIGQGLNDYDRIFSILQGVGFRGWVSIEDGDNPASGMEHLRESALFLRNKMAHYNLP